jgi:hypothetical protein
MDRSERKVIDSPKRKVWPGMDQMISDYDSLEKSLRDLRTVLAVIAWQQDDRTLSVPFVALVDLPAGVELEVSVDRTHGNYVFKAIPPESLAGGDVGGVKPAGDVL